MIMIIKTISRHTHWHVQHLKTVTTATEEFWNGNLRPAGWWILWWLRPPCPSSSGPFHLQSHHSLTHSSLAAGNTTGVTSGQVIYLNQSGHREDMQDASAEIFVRQLRELVPCCLPVHHLQPSTQSCLCILSVKQRNNKNTLESKRFPKLDPNCGTVCQLHWDSIIWRKLLRKAWRPTCSQKIRFVQTVQKWLFFFFFESTMSMPLQHWHFHALQTSSYSSSTSTPVHSTNTYLNTLNKFTTKKSHFTPF